jgi:cyclic pyranopterin phosphate synthase
MNISQLNHIDDTSKFHMVDVSTKKSTLREACAEALVNISQETMDVILTDKVSKGNIFAAAQLAGIQAAKRTWELVPLCHPLSLTHVSVNIDSDRNKSLIRVNSTCRLLGQTGVEMEALTAVSIASLVIYDMCKALQKDITISDIRLISKIGGKSDSFLGAKHD